MQVTVLIVDDHPGFRSYARTLLEAEGFEVIGEAPDAATAMTMVRSLKPDLVLLDVRLPDVDGLQLTEQLDRDDDCPDIVLISTRDAADYGALLRRSSARGFIPKNELSGQRLRALLGAPHEV